jgi:DNA-binding NtrC family response regulator
MIGTDFLQLEQPPLPFPAEPTAVTKSPIDLPAQLDELERRELSIALERCDGNKAEVARMLGIQRTTLYYRLKRLGIEA